MITNLKMFPEIKTEIKYFNIKLDYDEKLRLPYKVIQYQKLHNQDKKYVDRLKKQKIIIKHFRRQIKDQVIVVYYKLYATRIIEIKYKNILAYKLINKLGIDTENYLGSNNPQVLEGIASYILSFNPDKNDYILNNKKIKEIKKHEKVSYSKIQKFEDSDGRVFDYKARRPIFKSDDNKAWGQQSRNAGQFKRWKNSRTYRINKRRKHDTKFEWCLVDTENRFEFDGEVYEIDRLVSAYKVRDQEMVMDKILVYYWEDKGQIKFCFYDQNINKIKSKFVRKVGKK